MSLWSWGKEKVLNLLKPWDIVPAPIRKGVEKVVTTVEGIILGWGAKDTKKAKANQPKPDDEARTSKNQNKTKSEGKKAKEEKGVEQHREEEKKKGIQPMDIAKTVATYGTAGATIAGVFYSAEKILEWAGVRDGAGLVGPRPADMQPIGRGAKEPAPKKRKKGHVHRKHVRKLKHVRKRHKHKHGKRYHKHQIVHKKVKGHKKYRHVHKKKKKVKKRAKGKRVSFITKGGKRVSFIAKR